MHPSLAELFRRLANLRQDAGLSIDEVRDALVLGPGWVERIEAGEDEPSLGLLAALLDLYGTNIPRFFANLDFGNDRAVVDRHISAVERGADLRVHFPMGQHKAAVTIGGASLVQFNDVLREMRDALSAGGEGAKRQAVVSCFLKAVQTWPNANPSDLWYFIVSHAYQDEFNHPASEAGRDLAQSWKRASGWALERVYVEHYNPFLSSHGVRLVMPTDPAEKARLLLPMGVTDQASAEKADVIALGTRQGGDEEAFGVVHVKASFAERRTDDVPLSIDLISRGYASPLLTMDCKAAPSETPTNRGELGPSQGNGVQVSSKRLDIERDRKFDACFSYNTRTIATPPSQSASARIVTCDFSDPDDAFTAYLTRRWKDRQGLP